MNNINTNISSIINKVKNEGDKALVYYLKKYDKIELSIKDLCVSKAEIDTAVKTIDPLLKKSINNAAKNILRFHKTEMKFLKPSWFIKDKFASIGQFYSPVEKAGLYVPGGRFPYPSTVLMTAIPAKAAGVKKIVMVTPPNGVTTAVLYAAHVCGVDAVYRVGGPAAIAALAYGTDTIPSVDLIAGPGNAYVNEAKRQVYGAVGIDSLAGPSEVAILADETADIDYIITDLMAQAEHDPRAKSYLFSDSSTILETIKKKIPGTAINQIQFKKASIDNSIELINKLAPEHVEILTKNSSKTAKKIKNAGAIFVGNYTPTAVGDYWAGPSHVLPTAGSARFSSGLSAVTFLKRTSYTNYTKKALNASSKYIQKLAESEGLKYHRNSVEIRTQEDI